MWERIETLILAFGLAVLAGITIVTLGEARNRFRRGDSRGALIRLLWGLLGLALLVGLAALILYSFLAPGSTP
ncbi:MAG: hypothetical protein ACE5IP_03710 [Terriglobia bacterium]